MRNIMHVRLALLALGCIIFGVEARHGGCGCGCGPVKLIPGPRGPVGPMGTPVFASFYTNANVALPTYGIPFTNTVVATPGITLNAGGASFQVQQSGWYKISYVVSANLQTPIDSNIPQGGFVTLNGGGATIETTGTVFISRPVAPPAFGTFVWTSATGQAIVQLTTGTNYALVAVPYDGGQTSTLSNSGFGQVTSAQLTVELVQAL